MVQSCIFLLLFAVGTISAVPLTSNRARVRRDGESSDSNSTIEFNGCTLDDVEYTVGQVVPSLSPCEKCICEAPDVVCSMIKCQPNSGCRIIQQSGQCCPDYKCDCEYNGRVYNNGERLDKPEDPCQVCYCKGGEIMCTSITCYERDDCQPHFSPGQCCPKYDHCPVESNKVSNNSVRSVNASVYSPKREMQPWPLTKPSNTQSSVNYDELNGSQNIYPQTIKILEILPTTPGYINKPSEVSVIPRVKTLEEGRKEELLQVTEANSSEENMTTLAASVDSFISTVPASSTSEIEHLIDTTTQTFKESENNSSESVTEEIENDSEEVIPERSVSTVNPLSESVPVISNPDAEPDSQKMSKIIPNYSSTTSEINSSEESTTADTTTEVEGFGYELIKGGIYEEYSSESPEFGNIVNTTDIDEVLNKKSNLTQEATISETQGSSNYEESTEIETFSSEENSSNNTSLDVKLNNDQSSEVFDSDDSNSKMEVDLPAIPVTLGVSSSTEQATTFNANSSDITENNSVTDNETTSEYYTTYSTDDFQPLTNSPSFNHDLNLESRTEMNDISTLSLIDKTDIKSVGKITEDESESTTVSATAQYTQSEETSEINEQTTKKVLREYKRVGSRKVPRLADANDYEPSSTLSFPSVLKVQSLGKDQMSTQTESTLQENTTSMARVGIYHPTKPNELAGYLTIVDDKINISSTNNSIFSSHLLLTPEDLKKLAEILIHEKIKPAQDVKMEMGTTKNDEKFSDNPKFRELDDVSKEDTLNETINSAKEKGSSSSTSSESEENPTEKSKEIDENKSNFGLSTISQSSKKDYLSDDPNTSRQIRIPERGSHQYSSLLDDRDLLILENFFRKNIGLQ